MANTRAAKLMVRSRSRRDWRAAEIARKLWRGSCRAGRAWRTAHLAVQIPSAAILLLALWLVSNLVYQVARKPSELLLPFSTTLLKPPEETWRDYAPLFREYATQAITPELLAALAQVESAGNPLASTYWRWRFSWNPFAIYQPASSAVGMFQMTDGAFTEAKRYCIRDHRVIEARAHDGSGGCWLTSAYLRILPSHAIELAAIYLDRKLAGLAEGKRFAHATAQQKQAVATIIHLCGSGPAAAYLHRGFRLIPGEHCGDQDVSAYLARVNKAKLQFLRLAEVE
jgi:hypothetical protein